MSKYFLIHDLVRKKEIFEQACAEDVQCSVIDSITTPTLPNDLTHLALVFDNTGKKAHFLIFDEQEVVQYNEYLESMNSDEPKDFVQSNFLYNSTKFFSPSFMTFITEYKSNNPSFEYLDLITCNVKEEKITEQAEELLALGVVVRYSTNFTGKDGDWILESHNVNVTDIYFRTEGSDGIKSYPYQLGVVREIPVDGIITTAAQLYSLMTTTDGLDLDKDYTLDSDIDMGDFECQSIGSIVTGFTGSFDGQKHNVYINKISTTYNGFFNLIINGAVSNCNIIYVNDLIFNKTDGDPVTMGGLAGTVEDSTVSNCNVILGNNVELNCAGIGASDIGGLIGFNSTGTVSNCNVIYGNETKLTNNTDNSNIGGLIGRMRNSGSITNCNVIYGDNTILQCNGLSCYVGGLVGDKIGSPQISDCTGIFKNYSIIGTNTNAIIGNNTLSNVNRCYTLTFGTADPSSGVQNMDPYDDTPANLVDVRTALETSLYSEWLVSLLAIREKLNEDGSAATPAEVLVNNPLYLNNIVGNGEPPISPDVSLDYKNAALQLSMAYSDTPFINSDFGTIKSLLSTYTTATEFFNGKTIEYLNTPTDKAYTLEKQKFYYIPVSDGTISVNSSTPIPFVTSKSPAGISYEDNFTSINETYSKVGVASFTTYGIGSGLIGIDEPSPIPPVPVQTASPISWWWVLICLVVLFIVIGLYIYFFKYDHWFDSSPFSKEL